VTPSGLLAEGRRLGVKGPSAGAHLGPDRQAQIDLRLVHRDRDAVPAQALHDQVGAAVGVVRPLARLPGKSLDQAPGLLQADLGQHGLRHVIHHALPTRLASKRVFAY
jgi:hypothetical protein